MNGKEILRFLAKAESPDPEELRKRVIAEVRDKEEQKNRKPQRRYIPVFASALAVFIAAAFLLNSGLFDRSSDGSPGQGDGPGIVNETTIADTIDPEPDTTGVGVFIPPLDIDTTGSPGSSADMIGFFIYQGEIYRQATWYYGAEALHLRNLLGDKVLTATGGIDEWSGEEAYESEYAGSVSGDFYSVDGYDPNFRLALTDSYLDDNGQRVIWLNFYERLYNIRLINGSDLFLDRLKLDETWVEVKKQTQSNWNNDIQEYQDLDGVSREQINEFLDQLNDSPFEYVYETVGRDFYDDDEKQAHLHFKMPDGTIVRLHLRKDGYVGYQELGWYYVKMPGDIFNLIFEASH